MNNPEKDARQKAFQKPARGEQRKEVMAGGICRSRIGF